MLFRSDDISVVVQEPREKTKARPTPTVFYFEDKNLITTDQIVEILDMQTKPEPTKVEATGMRVHLLGKTAAPAGPGKTTKPKSSPLGDVERVVLLSGVEMHLWVDARSAFMTTGKPEEAAKTDPKVILKPGEGIKSSAPVAGAAPAAKPAARSEERRVGKECRL